MKFSSINIEGNILSTDLLSKIEDGSELTGQTPSDFGLETGDKVSDSIQSAWAMASNQWQVFKERREQLDEDDYGTTLVRRFWIEPLLDLLGYNPEYERKAEEIMNRPYPISHREIKRGRFPIHIVGFQDKALDAPEKRSTLDVKPSSGITRMSPHAMVQEYLNLTEHLYAIVSNGLQLRVLRDSSRLVKLSYIEFNLEQMMEEGHFSDFRLLFRLVHATRMPLKEGEGSESHFEKFHQESLINGESIRDGLGMAVEDSILQLANGFLQHKNNFNLRELVEDGTLTAKELYQYILRLIYRLLFLMVIEERRLVFSKGIEPSKRNIYYHFYSVNRLRQLAESNIHADKRFTDYWEALKNTFRLFEKDYYGSKLGIKPLGGDLFNVEGIGYLYNCSLDNQTLLQSLKRLGLFKHKETKQYIRVNYANLNVEEFGSVYEGLLEYEPKLIKNGRWVFEFYKGSERSKTGSHYTPDELVQPLIKHSLDHQIKDRIEHPDNFIQGFVFDNKNEHVEKALLDLRVADVACGSGHILLSAARRIGLELARIRTGEDQPSPEAMRKAIRDVITNCIYGVDKNPMAVELCKVALWLEAHNPGEPLNFLDHQIKCGDAIVGMAHFKELMNGVPDEAFKKTGDDDILVASTLLKANKKQRKTGGQLSLATESDVVRDMSMILRSIDRINAMPEQTPEQIDAKQQAYEKFVESGEYWHLKTLADIPISQFYIPKNQANKEKIITDKKYRQFLSGNENLKGIAIAKAQGIANDERIFHWFLEFPEVMDKGGFDCIIGNPPFLGDRRLKGAFGEQFLEWIRYNFTPGATVDLVVYFFIHIYRILKKGGFQSLISTNTVAQGKAREEGLAKIISEGGSINHAVKSMRWPGKAAVEVSLVTIHKGDWQKPFYLSGCITKLITSYLDDSIVIGDPFPLYQNINKSFQGTIVLGSGFVLDQNEAEILIDKNPSNADVIQQYLNGSDLNGQPDQKSTRYVINFRDWPLRRYTNEKWIELEESEKNKIIDRVIKEKIVAFAPPNYQKPVAEDYPDCLELIEKRVKPERTRWKSDKHGNEIVGKFQLRGTLPIYWWRFAETRPKLYQTIEKLERVLVVAQVSKTLGFVFVSVDQTISMMCIILTYEDSSHFSIFQSDLHKEWVHKYGSALKNDIRYTPSDVFDTFPQPHTVNDIVKQKLESIGEKFHSFREKIMLDTQLGLTGLYNLFHSPKPEISLNVGAVDLLKLRQLHEKINLIVLEAYGWDDIKLRLDFYEVDYLPDNDNIRFTIHPDARREILARLLDLNHTIFEEEARQGLHKEEDVEAFYKQKGAVPDDVEFSDKKRRKPKPAQKQEAAEGVQTLFDILDREETMLPFTLDSGIYTINDAKNIINSVLDEKSDKLTYHKVRRWFKELAELNYQGLKDSVDRDIENLRISFHGMIELYVIGVLRDQKFTLRKIMKARDELKRITGKAYPFATNNVRDHLKVSGSSIIFQLPTGEKVELDGTGQINLDLIKHFFTDIYFNTDGIATQIIPSFGDELIIIDPKVEGGKPIVRNNGVWVETIVQSYSGPDSADMILDQYDLEEKELTAALKYSQHYQN
ncbi:MAG: DUF433 domain-containing protein [Balneolales bacterium]